MSGKQLGIAAAVLGVGLVGGLLLLGGESIAIPSDQAAAWAAVNDEVLPALSAEAEAIATTARLDADVVAAEAQLADLRAQAKAAKDAEKVARAAAKASRNKLATLANVLDRLPASLKASGQLVAVEQLKREPVAAVP